MPLAVVMAELQEVAKDIAVASFQLFEDCALWFLLITKQGCTTTVIADTGQKQTICTILAEHGTVLQEVAPKDGIGLLFGDRIA